MGLAHFDNRCRQFRDVLILLLALGGGGCAHTGVQPQAESPRATLKRICSIGSTARAVQGAVWIKATSKEASGRFPGQVRVTSEAGSNPSSLRLEATNLLGGVEAVITIEGKKYTITIPGHPEQTEKGVQAWAGIPLEWATDLFLGKIPCPESVALSEADVQFDSLGKLLVRTASTLAGDRQTFAYQLKREGAYFWPESLHWEKQGIAPAAVDFLFFEPEDRTQSPLRWEAKSTFGEVKLRWKDRDVH